MKYRKLISIKEHKTMNGREVPIYKVDWVTDEQYKQATIEALKKLGELDPENKPADELLSILKEHAKETTGAEVFEPTMAKEA